ncbi:MAG: methylated-DNA/protein-cysteine methyltransferase [Akkermansiaceae bacterium]|nr:methylated-DNA/protein-cysteine methyltransferase [Akkermansiaceae bacterium]
MATPFYYTTMKSPVGELKVVASDRGLTAILWENEDPKRVPLNEPLTEKIPSPSSPPVTA